MREAQSTGPAEEVVATDPQFEIAGQRKCVKEKEMGGQIDVQSDEGGDKSAEFKTGKNHTPQGGQMTEFHFQTLDYVNSPRQLQVRPTTVRKSRNTPSYTSLTAAETLTEDRQRFTG